MNPGRLLSVTLVLLVVAFRVQAEPSDDLGGPLPGTTNSSADSPPPPTSPDDLKSAIEEKQAEIDALKKQLHDAQSQIKTLHKQNDQLQTSDDSLKTEIKNNPPAVPPRPAPAPLQATPNLAAPVNSQDLFWYFHNNSGEANQYLRGKHISVNGKIVGFEPPLFRTIFAVQLESGDPNLRVVCKFGIPRAYATVYFKRQSGTLVGRTTGGTEDVLLNLNDVITVEGKCEGRGRR